MKATDIGFEGPPPHLFVVSVFQASLLNPKIQGKK